MKLKFVLCLFFSLIFSQLFSQIKFRPKIAFSFSAREYPLNIKAYQPTLVDTFLPAFGNVRMATQSWGDDIIDHSPRIGIDLKQKISNKFPLEIQIANYFFHAPIEKFGSDDGYRELRLKRDHFIDLMYALKEKIKNGILILVQELDF